MADYRTPAQLALVRDSMNKIADPKARRDALRDLESEIITAQDSANTAGDDPKAYGGVLTAVQRDVSQATSDYHDSTAAPKAPPTPGQEATDKNTVELQRQRDANQKAGKGYLTDAELTSKGQSDESHGISVETAQINLSKLKIELDRLVKNDPSKLEQAKFQYEQEHNALKDLMEQERQNQLDRSALLTAQSSQDSAVMAQGNARAAAAASDYGSAMKTVGDMAKGMAPGQGMIAAQGMDALLNGGKDYQTQMGGAPQTPAPIVTTEQKQQIAALMFTKGMGYDDAVKAVAQGHGVMPDQAGPPPSGPMGPGSMATPPAQFVAA